mmetsp:Transcript_26869/g.41997  ORF Transcript_26869/g.41997 Transcript_26869/m.41997 type:complete len:270 (-) Transcript_26869:570-1379(-)
MEKFESGEASWDVPPKGGGPGRRFGCPLSPRGCLSFKWIPCLVVLGLFGGWGSELIMKANQNFATAVVAASRLQKLDTSGNSIANWLKGDLVHKHKNPRHGNSRSKKGDVLPGPGGPHSSPSTNLGPCTTSHKTYAGSNSEIETTLHPGWSNPALNHSSCTLHLTPQTSLVSITGFLESVNRSLPRYAREKLPLDLPQGRQTASRAQAAASAPCSHRAREGGLPEVACGCGHSTHTGAIEAGAEARGSICCGWIHTRLALAQSVANTDS